MLFISKFIILCKIIDLKVFFDFNFHSDHNAILRLFKQNCAQLYIWRGFRIVMFFAVLFYKFS